MTVPKYHEMYRPFLDSLQDEKFHTIKEIKEVVAVAMSIDAKARKEMLPSGRQPVFDNRIGWTRTYLKKAGLIDSPSRGVFSITPEGIRLLQKNPAIINDELLMRYESFRLFKSPYVERREDTVTNQMEDTPQDILDNAYKAINASLADEILTEIMKQSPSFFEELVVILLEKMGYGGSLKGAGEVVGKIGDEGIDGVIREDKLGFSLIYIQAKRWDLDRVIGRPEIQKFVGALAGQGAKKGLFITTAQFSKEAISYAQKQHTTKVVLVDGEMLAKLMIDNDLGVSMETTYEIKKVDTDFFND